MSLDLQENKGVPVDEVFDKSFETTIASLRQMGYVELANELYQEEARFVIDAGELLRHNEKVRARFGGLSKANIHKLARLLKAQDNEEKSKAYLKEARKIDPKLGKTDIETSGKGQVVGYNTDVFKNAKSRVVGRYSGAAQEQLPPQSQPEEEEEEEQD